MAVRNDWAVIVSDFLNRRLVRTDADFTVPADGLSVDARGNQVTFRWHTALPGPSSVRLWCSGVNLSSSSV